MASLSVFLSSTATDLVEYRRVADDTILRLFHKSVTMQRFGPVPGTPVSECESLAASCDVLVCIVGHRHGYEPEPGRGSITRREVQAAHRNGRRVYAWIVADDYPWVQEKEQDRLVQPEVLSNPGRVPEILAAVNALQDFKSWLRHNFVTDTFTTPDDLGRKIGTTLATIGSELSPKAEQFQAATKAPEFRIVHALQPAPHFSGRTAILKTLSSWVDELSTSNRIHALVAAGGTGKTALAQQVVAHLQKNWSASKGNVLVWSFYERPDASAFMRECIQLVLGASDSETAVGRLERLQRGLANGQPHLLVLDGIERMQAEAGTGWARGRLEDPSLRILLRSVAAGLGNTRALVTSRYPLADLHDWAQRGFLEFALEDLTPQAARGVLRGWGIQGSDHDLDVVSDLVGRHALSVAVIGSYLRNFESCQIDAAAKFDLAETAGDDPKAARLARVLAFYAERLPAEERDLLTRLSVFSQGITLDLMSAVADAGGEIAGQLAKAKPALARLLARLLSRGLVFKYSAPNGTLTWTAHPFVRDHFASMLRCPADAVISAATKRVAVSKAPLRFPGWELRPVERLLIVGDIPCRIGTRAYDLLLTLAQAPGRLFTKNQLLDGAWPGLVVEENNLSVQISALRRVLGPAAIKTVPGRGYQLSCEPESAPTLQAPFNPPSAEGPKLAQQHRLWGREVELAELPSLVSGLPLVSLIGSEGVGKTALARAVVALVEQTDQVHVIWIDLYSIGSGDMLLPLICESLGIPRLETDGDMDQLVPSLATSKALVVLDHCERVRSAVVEAIGALRRDAPGVSWLATTSQPLLLNDEWIYRLEPLAVPTTNVSADEALHYGAVAMFHHAAMAANRNTESNANGFDTIISLCRMLDGCPLALEIAAARVKTLGLQLVYEQIAQLFRLPASLQDTPHRRLTVLQLYEWSYGLLTPTEQCVFRRLGPLPSQFTLREAAHLCCSNLNEELLDMWAVLDGLNLLVEISLVKRTSQVGTGRFNLSKSARQLAYRELERAGELEAVREHCARLVPQSMILHGTARSG